MPMEEIVNGKCGNGAARPLWVRNNAKSMLAAAMACMLFLAGCLQEPSDSQKGIEFSGFPSSVSATPASPAVISGTIEAGSNLDSVILEVYGPEGDLMERSKETPRSQTFAVEDQEFGFTAADCIGTYEIKLIAYAGADSKSHTTRVALTGAKDCSDQDPDPVNTVTVHPNLALGAQDNPSLGSSIDLDAPSVMLASPARSNAAKVDLVYLNSFATDTDKLGSPAWAKDQVDFMDGWSVFNSTRFHKVVGTTFASVQTVQQLAALWNNGSATTTSLDVRAGDLVIARTDQGAYVLIEIVSQVPGATGEIRVKVAK